MLVQTMQKLSGGTVYDLSIHLVLVTKYRRKVINGSRRIRQEFPSRCAQFYHKPVFWKIGYFVSSTGGANLETVKRYIQQQNAPTR
jgi:putative transposase